MENTNDSTTAGLESIALVALQALGGTKKNDVDKRTINNTGTSSVNTTSTSVPPPLPTMEATTRVVTMDNTIGEDDESSTSSQTSKSRTSPTARMPTHQEKKTSSADPLPPNTSVDSSATATATATATTADASSSKDNSSSSSNGITSPAEEVANFSRILSDPESWLRETERENMFGKLAPIDTKPISGDGDNNKIVVQPNDVLCGRGGETNHHPGNVQYRSLVKAYQKLYLLAKRRDKPKIAQCIVVSVRGAGGRFLKRIKKSALIPTTEDGPAWVDVGNTKAREKTSQALREGAPDLRENVTTTTTTTGSSTVKNIVNMNIHTSGLVEAPHRQEHTIIPTTTSTAFEAMMELSRMPAANGSSSSSSNNIDKDALTAKAFAAAATKLMQHPIFHQLTPSQQQEAILHELKAARASALASTTSTTSPSPSSATSPMIGPMTQSQYPHQHHPQHPHHHHPQQHVFPPYAHEQHSYYQRDQYGHPYQTQYGPYPHDVNRNRSNSNDMGPANANANTNTNATSIPPPLNGRKVDIQSMYREVLVAKAAAAAMDSSNGGLKTAKKRPAPSSSTSSSSSTRLKIPPTIVSDTGSEASSLSSSSSNSLMNTINNNTNDINNKDKDNAAVNGGGTGGPRLKRFKSRLKDTVN
jgi:hypothetical protein